MKPYRLALLLIGCFCLLFSVFTVYAQDDEFELQCISDDRFLQIYSDHAIDQTSCKSIVDHILNAYAFVSTQESWSNTIPLAAKPLKVRLTGELKEHTLGYAHGANLMVIKDKYMNDHPFSEGTLAHELTHIQDSRQLQGSKLPSYMLEGRASINGHAYRIALGQADNRFDRQMAGSAMRFTSSDAEELLSDYHGRGWKNQVIGAFFVEYMRTKWNGTGISDTHHRLAHMIEIMAKGSKFEMAFQKEFGATFDVFCASFIKYLDDTQNDPRVRLQKTMWQSTDPSYSPGELGESVE